MGPFILSIEPVDGPTFMHGFHLGTDERVAREVAVDIFKNRKWFPRIGNTDIRTVALMRDGKIFDVYDGEWTTDVWAKLYQEQEEYEASIDKLANYE